MVDFDSGREERMRDHLLTGGPAHGGVTVRDYFAAKALQGLLANSSLRGKMDNFVADAWCFAELMMRQRNKRQQSDCTVEEAFGL